MKKKNEFSKSLLIWETILIWIVTLSFIGLVFFCIVNQYNGELTWLATVYAFPWTAYGVSQACYYRKAGMENTKGGIKYDSIMNTITNVIGDKSQEDAQDQTSENEEAAG